MFNTEISILLNTEILKFNSIEYWKCSILIFQYYWIPKIFNTEISILLNTKKVSILKFNSTKLFGISPDLPKIPKCTIFSAKEIRQFCFSKNFWIFFDICLVFFGIFGIDKKNTEFWDENWILKKKIKFFFGFFYRKCSTFRYFRYFGNTKNISNTVQYYWILKMFNTRFSILTNIKKVPIPQFNNTEKEIQ